MWVHSWACILIIISMLALLRAAASTPVLDAVEYLPPPPHIARFQYNDISSPNMGRVTADTLLASSAPMMGRVTTDALMTSSEPPVGRVSGDALMTTSSIPHRVIVWCNITSAVWWNLECSFLCMWRAVQINVAVARLTAKRNGYLSHDYAAMMLRYIARMYRH